MGRDLEEIGFFIAEHPDIIDDDLDDDVFLENDNKADPSKDRFVVVFNNLTSFEEHNPGYYKWTVSLIVVLSVEKGVYPPT